jgi:hypothetical protein
MPFKTIILAMIFVSGFLGSAGAGLKLKAAASEMYDDNITYQPDDRRQDWITSLGLGLGLSAETPVRNFDLSGQVVHQLFAERPTYNNTAQDLTFRFRNEFSARDRIQVQNVFAHTHEPRSFEETLGRSGGRFSYYRNKLNVGYTREVLSQWSMGLRYANEIDEISRDDIRDSYLNAGGTDLSYSQSSARIFTLGYGYSQRRFENNANSDNHTVTGAVRQYFTKQLYFDAKSGVDFIRSYSGRQFVKPVIFASLTDELDNRTNTSLSYAKEYHTISYSEDLFNYWQATGQFTRQLLRRLGGSVSGFYGEGTYVDSSVEDRVLGANATLSYDLLAYLKGNLSYAYSNIDSNVHAREYVKNTVFFGLLAEF